MARSVIPRTLQQTTPNSRLEPQAIQDLKPVLVQVWTLVSLAPMHRAIAIRAAERQSQPIPSTSIQWQFLDVESILSTENDGHGSQPSSVLIVDRDVYLKQMSKDSSFQDHSFPNCIQLIWSWNTTRKEDLLWCTEAGFDGMITDMTSLEQWCRVSCQRAVSIEQSASPILRGIQLPTL